VKGRRSLTDTEIRSIFTYLGPRNQCIFILGIRTGFRISELLSLNIGDVYDGVSVRGSILLKKSSTKGKTEGRVCVLHSDASKLLSEYIDSDKDNQNIRSKIMGADSPLFRTRCGRLESSVFHKALKKACSRANIQDAHLVATHSMRKTFALKVYLALDENIHKLQRAMGHRNLSSTSAYIGVDDEEIGNAIKNVK